MGVYKKVRCEHGDQSLTGCSSTNILEHQSLEQTKHFPLINMKATIALTLAVLVASCSAFPQEKAADDNSGNTRGLFGFGGRPHGGRPHGGFGGQGGFGGGRPQTANCRYWCKTPEGKNYCCENNAQQPLNPLTALVTKPGFCPTPRAECPLRSHFGGPQTCSGDGSCFGSDRCCFDRCLGEHVCKQPLPYQG